MVNEEIIVLNLNNSQCFASFRNNPMERQKILWHDFVALRQGRNKPMYSRWRRIGFWSNYCLGKLSNDSLWHPFPSRLDGAMMAIPWPVCRLCNVEEKHEKQHQRRLGVWRNGIHFSSLAQENITILQTLWSRSFEPHSPTRVMPSSIIHCLVSSGSLT